MQVRSASAKAFTARAPCVARVSIRAAHSRGALRVQAIKVGDMLPAFELETDASTAQNKVTVKSQDMVKDSGAVIFFYPKAATSGCTLQACQFRDERALFEGKGYKVYGMSADTPAEQAAWKKEHGLTYPLLCDTDKKVMTSLGLIGDASKINRSHLVIAKGGKVEDAQIGVGSKDSVPKALQFVKTIKV